MAAWKGDEGRTLVSDYNPEPIADPVAGDPDPSAYAWTRMVAPLLTAVAAGTTGYLLAEGFGLWWLLAIVTVLLGLFDAAGGWR